MKSVKAADADRVDSYIAAVMKAQQIPGLSLAIIQTGSPLKIQGYGYANLEHSIPVTPETIFQSGSVGKQFTAAAILLLVEDGKIGLDDLITKYLKRAPASWKGITVRQLLNHTSGLPEYTDDFNLHLEYTEDELVQAVAKLPLDFPPGTKWKYSNSGYMVLGVLIHKATGKFYGDLLQRRIFKPLQMNTARVISEADIIPHRAAGYVLEKGELENQSWVSPSLNTTADGSLYFSIQDLVKWDAALRDRKVLKPASYELWWTPGKLNNGEPTRYGFGWAVKNAGGHRVVEHSGSWQGFQTHIARYLDDDLTVIVLTNQGNAKPTQIAHGVAELFGAPPVPNTK